MKTRIHLVVLISLLLLGTSIAEAQEVIWKLKLGGIPTAISPDGSKIAVGTDNGYIYLISADGSII
jgi:hypothetical protein